MTFLRIGFRAEKGHGALKIGKVEASRNTTVEHELPKHAFIRRPVPGVAISCPNFRGGREARFVGVSYTGYAIQEEGEIRVFRKSRKLPNSILANINELLNACILQQGEKLFRGFPGKPDRTDGASHPSLPELERAGIDTKCTFP